MNDPLVPLPPAWKLMEHHEHPSHTATLYERGTDRLRVMVTDTRTDTALVRYVTASAPGGPITPSQERQVLKHFLRADRPLRAEKGIALAHLWARRQALEGELATPMLGENVAIGEASVPVNRELIQYLYRHPGVTKADVRGEKVTFELWQVGGHWRHRFTRHLGERPEVTDGQRERLSLEAAASSAGMHYECVRAGGAWDEGLFGQSRPIDGATKAS